MGECGDDRDRGGLRVESLTPPSRSPWLGRVRTEYPMRRAPREEGQKGEGTGRRENRQDPSLTSFQAPTSIFASPSAGLSGERTGPCV